MLTALLDTTLVGLLPPLVWAVILLTAAMALAAVRRHRGPRRPTGAQTWVSRHAMLGMLLSAALRLASIAGAVAPVAPQGAHGHASAIGPALVTAIVSLGAVAYAVLSVYAFARVHDGVGRAQVAAMALAVLVLAGTLIG
ncbi:hypothetical protein SAMN05428970_3819 [Agromyces sp. CF514]|uniref:hypothetical protein n=1 Tax=Agromyces sp. CF514 TaxID=1881031 RepID=UPI0008E38D1B|nr:hypothetical protein [Agromyces sp. CF514]SFR91607.1 hypothetical protein SAMN05428970_3819 [Agromyces sp. CF514]